MFDFQKTLEKRIISSDAKLFMKPILEIQTPEYEDGKTRFALVTYPNSLSDHILMGQVYFDPSLENPLKDFFAQIKTYTGRKYFYIRRDAFDHILDIPAKHLSLEEFNNLDEDENTDDNF